MYCYYSSELEQMQGFYSVFPGVFLCKEVSYRFVLTTFPQGNYTRFKQTVTCGANAIALLCSDSEMEGSHENPKRKREKITPS